MTAASTPEQALAWKSVKWRNAAGWVLVLGLSWRFVIHPITNAVLTVEGHPPLPPLDPISVADAIAVIGIPIGGSFADRMAQDTKPV